MKNDFLRACEQVYMSEKKISKYFEVQQQQEAIITYDNN